MKLDVALAGFLLTAEEWQSFDPAARAQLIAAASRREDAWLGAPLAGMTSEPLEDEAPRTQRRAFDLPLAPRGTGFQVLVWQALTRILHGETRSYRELAGSLGRPSACRAVGAANGRNPISIIVPCHRLIASNGDLTGYAGGLAAKRWLLEHERARLADRRAARPSLPR